MLLRLFDGFCGSRWTPGRPSVYPIPEKNIGCHQSQDHVANDHGCSEKDEWIDGCNDVKEDPDSAVSKLGFDEPSELGCQTGVDIENPQGQKEPRNEKSGPENEAPVPAHPMKYVDETREEGQDHNAPLDDPIPGSEVTVLIQIDRHFSRLRMWGFAQEKPGLLVQVQTQSKPQLFEAHT